MKIIKVNSLEELVAAALTVSDVELKTERQMTEGAPGPLRLTSYQPFDPFAAIMGEPMPKVRLPLVDEIGIFVNQIRGKWSGYLHGHAEELAGFDLPCFISGTLKDEPGEYPAVLVLPNTTIPCTLIQWRVGKSFGCRCLYHALILANDDAQGLAEGRRIAKEQA